METRSHSKNVELDPPDAESSDVVIDEPEMADDVSRHSVEGQAEGGRESSLQGEDRHFQEECGDMIQDELSQLWSKFEEMEGMIVENTRELDARVLSLEELVRTCLRKFEALDYKFDYATGRIKMDSHLTGPSSRLKEALNIPARPTFDGRSKRMDQSAGRFRRVPEDDFLQEEDGEDGGSIQGSVFSGASRSSYNQAARRSFGKLPEDLHLRTWGHETLLLRDQPKAPALTKSGKNLSKEDIYKFARLFAEYWNGGGTLGFFQIVTSRELQLGICVLLYPGSRPEVDQMRQLSAHELMWLIHEKCGLKSKFDEQGEFIVDALSKISSFTASSINSDPEGYTAAFVSSMFMLIERAQVEFGISETDCIKLVLQKKFEGQWQVETRVNGVRDLSDLISFVNSKSEACITAKKFMSEFGMVPQKGAFRDKKEAAGGAGAGGKGAEDKYCYICRAKGHLTKECKEKKKGGGAAQKDEKKSTTNDQSKDNGEVTCWGCGNIGHSRSSKQSDGSWKVTCPKKEMAGFKRTGQYSGATALAIPSMNGERNGLPFSIYKIRTLDGECLDIAFGADSLSQSTVISIEKAAILASAGAVISKSSTTLQVAGDNNIKSEGQVQFNLLSVECPGVSLKPILVTAEIIQMLRALYHTPLAALCVNKHFCSVFLFPA